MANDYSKIALQLQKHGNVQGLMQFVNKETLREQHENQEVNKAVGIDEINKRMYEEELDENLDKLIYDMKRLAYNPKAVRRTYIPKDGSDKLRPLGIPSYEDKLVQGNFAEILNEIYEPIFLDCSYGFRPGKDCHQAIERLDNIIMKQEINYIVDADIKGFFDNVSHEWMIKFLNHIIQDKTYLMYIKRFLQSGIMENGEYRDVDKGTPQGRINFTYTSQYISTLCTRHMVQG